MLLSTVIVLSQFFLWDQDAKQDMHIQEQGPQNHKHIKCHTLEHLIKLSN